MAVGRPGVGNAIDSTNYMIDYFAYHGVKVLGACWNKVPPMVTYHTFEACKTYVTKYYQQTGRIHTYGHIPLIESTKSSEPAQPVLACRLRPAQKDFEMTDEERSKCNAILEAMKVHLDGIKVWEDVQKYYETQGVSSTDATRSS